MNTTNNNLRNTMTNIVNFVFPVSATDLEKQRLTANKTGFVYVSHLPLQMMFYFNAFYSPFWLFGTALALNTEYKKLNELYQVGCIAIITLFTVLEVVRLYIGFLGNLTEKVPELAGSWLLTLLIQLPIICFLLFNTEMILSPFERAIHIVMFIFIVLEVITGFIAIRLLVNHQAVKFHVKMEYDSIENIPEDHEVHYRTSGNPGSTRYMA